MTIEAIERRIIEEDVEALEYGEVVATSHAVRTMARLVAVLKQSNPLISTDGNGRGMVAIEFSTLRMEIKVGTVGEIYDCLVLD